jgi:hypothetical protein
MLVLMLEQVFKAGYAARPDVLHHLNMSTMLALKDLDDLGVSRVAKKIDDTATMLLNALAPDDPVEGLFACVMFTLMLVDEGLLKDRHNQAVLVSLLLFEDSILEDKDVEGNLAVRPLKEAAWKKAAGHMLLRAQLTGLYLLK